MLGKIAAIAIVGSGLVAGIGMYYLQVYGYYETLEPQATYEVAVDGGMATLPITDFQGIDSFSSPLRYRACFAVTGEVPDLVAYAGADPLNAPGWFDCFQSAAIGEALTADAARAVLVASNAPYGFDRVMALYPDGRAYVWPQINACGTAHFDGDPTPAGCPPPPQQPSD